MKIKRFLTMFLAVTLLFAALPNMGTLTAVEGAVSGNNTVLKGKKIETEYGDALDGSDGEPYYEDSFTAVNYANGSYSTKKTNSFYFKETIGIDASGNESWLYCVEKNSKFSRDGYESSNVGNSNYLRMDAQTGTLARGLNKLAKDKGISGLDGVQSIRYILTATIYGWQPDATMPTELSSKGLNDWDWYFATQVIIWEFQQGIRQSPTQRNGNGLNGGDTLFQWLDGRPAEQAYNYILAMMAQHRTIPSFAVGNRNEGIPTHTLKWNATNKRYELTLTDDYGYAFNLKFEDSDIKCVKNGSNYTIYTTKTIASPVLCATQKDIQISENQELLVWGRSGKQTMVTGMQDPVEFYLKIQTELPTITIKKTGDSVADIANKLFHVYKDGSSVACLKLTTDANGNASGKLPGDGSYRIEEKNASKYDVEYTINGTSTQTFTYPGSRDANNNVTVNVYNGPKKGVFQLKKESEDGVVQGFQFRIQGSGVNVIGTTNASGYLVVNGSTDIQLKPGVYTVTEVNPPERYEPLEPFTINVQAEQTITKIVTNVLKPTQLTIQKASEDDVIAGVQFRITGTTLSGKHVNKTVVTGPDGTVTVDIEQGTYTVSEINVPGKYFTPGSQKVTLSYTSQTLNFVNELKPAQLRILKTSDDGIVDGLKFRVTGNGVDITGFTNEDGYVVFGDKAYMLDGKAYYGANRIAVVSKDATGYEVLSDLGLSAQEYSIVYNYATQVMPLDEVVANFTDTGVQSNSSITGSGYLGIQRTDAISRNTLYVYFVFQGSTYDSSAAIGNYGVTETDITLAKSVLGLSMGDNQLNNLYIAAYDLDRDGVVTQEDVDALEDAYNSKTDIIGSTTLDLEPGDYRIQEIEVPGRYTKGFDQTVTLTGANVNVVRVKNYVKASGVKIVKTSEDGVVAGLQFRITGTTTTGTAVNMTVTTDETGTIAQKLSYGTYTITEISVPSRYATPASQTVTLSSQDYVTVTFHNALKDAALRIRKTSEDGVISNISFRIQSIVTVDGSVIDTTVTTGLDGTIATNLPQGTYVVTELAVADRYVEPASQVVTLTAGRTSAVTFANALKISHLEIKKTSEDGVVEGITFTVTGTTITGDVYAETFVTDANGLIATDIPQGDYTVTEAADPRYEAQAPQQVSLRNDESKTLSFSNVLVTGKLEIKKTSEDGKVSGIPFHISGFGADGMEVDLTLKTNASGIITTELKPGIYTVTELLEDAKYIIQEPQIVIVKYGQTATVTFQNIVKKFQLSLTKTDGSTEIGIPQKDGAMEGAVYGLYKADGTLIAEYTTDKEGKFTTEAIVCDAAYVQEITAPEGYTLDESQYWLTSSVETCHLEVTNLSLEVVDYPVMGSINILKKMGLAEKWDYEAGAVFQIYPKSAGSYDAANDWERDQITTDAASGEIGNTGETYTGGEAGTKELPLGTYIVHQVSGAEGCKLAEDIEVVITEEETVISLEILNEAQDEFPFTGGSGVVPYVAGGILVMLMAAVVAGSQKKKATV